MYEPDDVVRIRHPFFIKRGWIVEKSAPSFKDGVRLHRVTLLRSSGERSPITVIVSDEQIIEHLGGYKEWLRLNQS